MAEFPIQYTEAGPKDPGRRYAAAKGVRIDVSTGGQVVAQGIAALGEAFQKIQDAKDTSDVSTLKRRLDEISYETLNQYKITGDEEERKVLVEQWDKQIVGLTVDKKYSGKAITAFNLHKNNVLPEWGQTFANVEAAIQKKQTEDAFSININKKMASGDISGAAADIWERHLLSPQLHSKAEAEADIENLPIDSVLMQAQVQINTNPALVAQTLSGLTGLNVEQLEQRNKLLRLAKATDKLQSDAAIEAEKQIIDTESVAPASEFLANAPNILTRINTSTVLSVKDKEQQRKKINDRIEAIISGKTDPVYEFDVNYYNQLSARIARDPRSVSETEINSAAGRGLNRGITAGEEGQQGSLIKLKRFLQGGDPSVHRTYTMAISGLKTARAFSKSKKQNARLAAEAQIQLDVWATKERRSPDDYQAFYDGLVDTIAITGEGLFWKSRKREAEIASENIAKYVEEFVGPDAVGKTKPIYKKGDTRTINGIIYTYDGKVWHD